MPGGVLSSSSNGTKAGTGIIRASHPLSGDANHETRTGILRAFNATNVATNPGEGQFHIEPGFPAQGQLDINVYDMKGVQIFLNLFSAKEK